MNVRIISCIASALAIALICACDSSPPSSKRGASTPARSPAPQRAYALMSRENSWPKLPEAAAERSVSENLLGSNYYVVLDGSGSMRDAACSGGRPKIEAARTALASFAESLPQDANLGLSAFDGRGLSERLPLGAGNRERFIKAVDEVKPAGNTPLKAAVHAAYNQLVAQGQRQLGYGEYHLVVVTDGIASQGQDPTPAVNAMLARSPVVVHTIGFCISDDHSLNQPGRTFYRTASDLDTLRKGLSQVLAESPDFSVSRFR